jgi:hypothetical protein
MDGELEKLLAECVDRYKRPEKKTTMLAFRVSPEFQKRFVLAAERFELSKIDLLYALVQWVEQSSHIADALASDAFEDEGGNEVVKAVAEHSKAKAPDRSVLFALADRADAKTGRTCCSNADIAKRAGASLRSVQSAKRRLVELGELEIEHQAGPHRVDVFTLTIYTKLRGRSALRAA